MSKDLKEVKKLAMQVFGEEGFGLKNGKCRSPRQEPARHAGDQARSPLWLEEKEEEIVRG